ncbi:MAG: hypothetical protein AseanaTS_25100 [Candidatus Pelagadaptatus aseana]|uniref:DcaP family trimeric outer membrane transporter n=1 Tax=Candidatus Pelagadaptatus aseana TaxID=3120508 RepID=UPI0039B20F75
MPRLKLLAAAIMISTSPVLSAMEEGSWQEELQKLRAELQQTQSALKDVKQELNLLKKGVSTQALDSGEPVNPLANQPVAEPGHALRISKSDIDISVNGYVRMDMIYEGDRTGSENTFVPAQIPVKWKPQNDGNANDGDNQYHIGSDPSVFTRGKQTNMHAKQSRLGISAAGMTDYGRFKTHLEGDFYGGAGDSFRLRHAYGELGNWLLGQTWTNFGSLESLPNTLDFEGPGSQMPGRNQQIRYKHKIDDRWSFVAALEDSSYDPANVDGANCGSVDCTITDFENAFPDVIANISYDDGPNFYQLALAWADLEVNANIDTNSDGNTDFSDSYNLNGSGVAFSGRHRFGDRHMLQYQYTWTDGMGHLITDLGNNDIASNAVLVNDGQSIKELEATAWQVAYQFWWKPNLSSTFVYSEVELDNIISELDNPHGYNDTLYTSANLVWNVTDRVTTGVEYLYGERTNNNGETGDASRIQFMSQFNFD